MTAGAVLVIAALLLFSHNRMEDYRAGKQAEETLRAVESAMDARGGTGETEVTAASKTPSTWLSTLTSPRRIS